MLPSYISMHGPGVNFTAIADEFNGYGSIDNPNFTDGTDTLSGFALATGGGAGDVREIATFTVTGLPAGNTVRVGLLGGVEATADGRWDSTSFTLSDGTVSATVGDHNLTPLPANPGGINTGWVFFDIDMDGTYTVSGTKRLPGQGAGLAGITFDSIDGAFDPDSDSDGILDFWEITHAGNLTDLTGLNAGPGPGADSGDFDGDGLTDLQEFDLAVTNETFPDLSPILADSDDDGFHDAAETNTGTFVSYDFATNTGDTGSHPTLNDTDSDNLLDGTESGTGSFIDATNTGSDPNVADTDLDGLNDDFEVTNNAVGYDPNVDDSASDFDGDASTLAQEIIAETDVLLADTDGDGFFDGAESNSGTFVSYDFVSNTGDTGTDPLDADTDDDGLLDGLETGTGVFVSANDTGTNPNEADIDGDGFSDSDELDFGGDPFVAESSLPNASFGYAATGGDWLTGFAANDIDGDGALGTDGFIFFGSFTGAQSTGDPYTTNVESFTLPSYLASNGPGADFTGVASGFASYGLIDDPNLLDGTDQRSGFALSSNGGIGTVVEVMTFEVSGLAAGQVVRVGMLAGVEGTGDGRWDPTEVFLSGPGGYLQARLDLEANPGSVNAGWLFFDIISEGTYSVSATRRANNGGAGIAGLTFDSTSSASSEILLTIAQNPNRLDLDFTWPSRPGFTYNLLSSTTLDTAPTTWAPVESGITPTGPNAFLSIPQPDDPRRFYAIEEVPAP